MRYPNSTLIDRPLGSRDPSGSVRSGRNRTKRPALWPSSQLENCDPHCDGKIYYWGQTHHCGYLNRRSLRASRDGGKSLTSFCAMRLLARNAAPLMPTSAAASSISGWRGQGRSDGFRALLVYRTAARCVFVYEFAKSERDTFEVAGTPSVDGDGKVRLRNCHL